MTDEELEPFFASDLAGEVMREFTARTDHGLPVPDATRDVLAHFGHLLQDPNDGPVVFLSLAALQYRAGRLMPFIRDASLDLIRTGEARRAYANTDPNLMQQRKKLLSKLEAALEGADVTE